MYNMHFYQRIATGLGIVASLLVLGACHRPRNQMIIQFQQQSNTYTARMASTVAKARAIAKRNGYRGVSSSSSNSSSGYVGMGYSANIAGDVNSCVIAVQAIPKEYKYYWGMVSTLIQCLKRQTVNSAAPLYGSAFPYMGDAGQAYLRYLVDPKNPSGQFSYMPYGYGYQWGNAGMSAGTSANDPLRLWQVLGGSGNGFYQGAF